MESYIRVNASTLGARGGVSGSCEQWWVLAAQRERRHV